MVYTAVRSNRNIRTCVSAIACYLRRGENCPDFQYQITECLTLIFNMSAIHILCGGVSQGQRYKEFVRFTQTTAVFFLLACILFLSSGLLSTGSIP